MSSASSGCRFGNIFKSKWLGKCLVYIIFAMIMPDIWHIWDRWKSSEGLRFGGRVPVLEAKMKGQAEVPKLDRKGMKGILTGRHFLPKEDEQGGKVTATSSSAAANSTTGAAATGPTGGSNVESKSMRIGRAKANSSKGSFPPNNSGKEPPSGGAGAEAKKPAKSKPPAKKPSPKLNKENANLENLNSTAAELLSKWNEKTKKKEKNNETNKNEKNKNEKKKNTDSVKATSMAYSANISAGPMPRYGIDSASNASVLLWSGDDNVTDSATTIVNMTKLEKKKNGAIIRGTPTEPGCKEECQTEPKCLKLNQGIGRLGNILSELHHMWYMLNASTWAKGSFISSRYMPYIFDFPEFVCLKDLSRFHEPSNWNGSNFSQQLAPECTKSKPVYDPICGEIEPAKHMAVAKEYITPYFSKDMSSCLAQTRPIDEEKLVTIHIRGEDVFGKLVKTSDYVSQALRDPIYWRMWRQPTCYFYEKLINESDWEHVLLITTQDLTNPCIRYLDERRSTIRNRNGQLLKWELQTGNIVSDVCAMMLARHLVVSSSSMTHNVAMLASTLGPRHVYALNWGKWRKEWLLRCNTPNMTLRIYENTGIRKDGPHWPNSTKVKQSFQTIVDWLLVSRSFSGPTDC